MRVQIEKIPGLISSITKLESEISKAKVKLVEHTDKLKLHGDCIEHRATKLDVKKLIPEVQDARETAL